ncbi:MAG: glycosyltransferase family 4 protein [Geminicoccaceae bacterium]
MTPQPGIDKSDPVVTFDMTKDGKGSADSSRRLRVTHFCQNDQIGGGPLASYRLHRALLGQGVDSRMLVMKTHRDDPTVETMGHAGLGRIIETPARIVDRLPLRAYSRRTRDVIWSPGWFSMAGTLSCRAIDRADLLSLYWINGGFLSISAIGRLLRLGKPVVWRLSDLWPFTGGCHHAGGCRGYEHICGRCPQLGSRSEIDLATRLQQAKTRWPTERLVVVSPSRWLGNLAGNSAVFADCRIEQIATGIDIETFTPRNRADARRVLGLPPDRTLVLFGANNGVRNPKKGFPLLIEALEQLSALGKADDVDLVVFGQKEQPLLPLALPIHMMGTIYSESTKALLFSAADIFATPSLEENLPNTVIEAMACGTPTVAFDVGGTNELIEHKSNGYLAKAGDSADFCQGLAFLLKEPHDMMDVGERARRFIVDNHNGRDAASRYLSLYTDLLNDRTLDQAA